MKFSMGGFSGSGENLDPPPPPLETPLPPLGGPGIIENIPGENSPQFSRGERPINFTEGGKLVFQGGMFPQSPHKTPLTGICRELQKIWNLEDDFLSILFNKSSKFISFLGKF